MTAHPPRRRDPATRGEIVANWLALLALLALGIVWPGEEAGSAGTRSGGALQVRNGEPGDAGPEETGVSGGESHGQGSGDRPPRHGRDRVRSDLRLPRGRLPRRTARAAHGQSGAGRLLPLDVLRRKLRRGGRN